ncbi:O-methylsterigmatocystin oxidoreductase [Trametes pubescens]|uniref:O-methylsterigmatocystin oxidoreductase n=1 Tax=Trametes pubescens TaxID=154538 RepID=A0A1M2W2Z1_TRAPU|nr:O-methylsterigmatocystin oxidoreductase [Trametes pubescens]
MALPSVDLLVVLACGVLSLLLWAKGRRGRLGPQPPGPPGLPLIGNLLDVPSPKDFPWDTYTNWCKQYDSDIIRINAMGMNIIVANSLEVANDLLDKRSAIYSDRPRMVMLCELSGFGPGLAFVPYNNFWKDQRRMARQEFHSTPVKRFRPVEVRSAYRFLRSLQQKPDDLMDNLRHLAGATIMSIGYDIEVQPHDDPYVQTAEEAVASITETTNAGSYLVDVIPILKYVPEWFPGAEFKKQARIWHAAVDKLFNDPYDACQKRLDAGELGDCAAKSMMETFGKNPTDPKYAASVIKSALGALYVGGADTTVSALGTFFLAMTLNPDVQEKARKQLDQVVGSHRLPSFNDQPSLPYIDAILKETIRWRPVVPLDVPHRLTEDDFYEGYYLPKGSLIVANTWAILHDEAAYPDAERYNPDRLLTADGTLDPAVRDPSVAAFGFGRRICPGRFMALDSMWITIACVLSMFEISKAVDEEGREITPDGEYDRGFLCHPKPFPCVIKPRSKEHEELLNELAQQDM